MDYNSGTPLPLSLFPFLTTSLSPRGTVACRTKKTILFLHTVIRSQIRGRCQILCAHTDIQPKGTQTSQKTVHIPLMMNPTPNQTTFRLFSPLKMCVSLLLVLLLPNIASGACMRLAAKPGQNISVESHVIFHQCGASAATASAGDFRTCGVTEGEGCFNHRR